MSHSGVNLAAAFARILGEFGISDKVSNGSKIRLEYLPVRLVKILSVTCDNASCNDTMIEALSELLEHFPGAANRTRCFAHILNLVAKSVIRQFDVAKGEADGALSDAEKALQDLADGMDLEDLVVQGEDEVEDDNIEEDRNEEGWIDEREELTEMERNELDKLTRPVKLVLVKVSPSLHQ